MTLFQNLCLFPLAAVHRLSRQSLPRTPEPRMLMNDPEQVAAYDRANVEVMDTLYCVVASLISMALPQAATAEALDLGCGSGYGILRIAEALRLRRVRALDLSPEMIRKARENLMKSSLAGRVDFELKDILALQGFSDASCDLTTCLQAAHHLENATCVRSLLNEMDRVTRPDGLVFLLDLVRPKSNALARLYVDIINFGRPAIFKEDYFNSLHASFTIAEMASLAPRAGPTQRWLHFTSPLLPLFQVLMRIPASRMPAENPLWERNPTMASRLEWSRFAGGSRENCLRVWGH